MPDRVDVLVERWDSNPAPPTLLRSYAKRVVADLDDSDVEALEVIADSARSRDIDPGTLASMVMRVALRKDLL